MTRTNTCLIRLLPGALAVGMLATASAQSGTAAASRPMVTITSTVPPPPPAPLPRMLRCPRPDYPPAAVRANAQGDTGVNLTVDENGQVTGVSLQHPSGDSREHRMMDMAVLGTFRHCEFEPAPGISERTTTLEYRWRLD